MPTGAAGHALAQPPAEARPEHQWQAGSPPASHRVPSPRMQTRRRWRPLKMQVPPQVPNQRFGRCPPQRLPQAAPLLLWDPVLDLPIGLRLERSQCATKNQDGRRELVRLISWGGRQLRLGWACRRGNGDLRSTFSKAYLQ